MKISWEDVKDAIVPTLVIFGVVYVFGKVVELNTDCDKNWKEYIDSLKKEK